MAESKTTSAGPAHTDTTVRYRLWLMMFLEYAAKGLWFPLASVFMVESVADGGLGFTPAEKGWIIAISSAVGATCAPVICRLCDKRFDTARFLGVLLMCVGVLKIITSRQTTFEAWMLLAVAFSALVGVVAGIFPAYKAAGLHPIQALRYE